MLKFFKKEGDERQESLVRGLTYGLGGALIILIIVLLVIFGGKIKNRINGNGDGDVSGNGVAGEDAPKLRLTVLTSKDCGDQCFDINLFIDALRQNNINETGFETLYIEDSQGKDLADRYAINKVPTVLIAGELDKNEQLAQAWPVLGEVIDDIFVFRQLIPPYIEVASGNLRGQFSLVYLTDDSCDECYDVTLHDMALTNLGLKPQSSQTIDVSSSDGQDLVDKYDITLVPTVVMNGDLSEYSSLQQVWPVVGTIADDGAYIFTGMNEMGTHRDLETGDIIEIETPVPPVEVQ